MTFTLLLDILVAVLLVITIVYAVILNRRLGALRADKSELDHLAQHFSEATVRAEESVGKLRKTADELQTRIAKAQALADDLSFLVDRGASAADRLEDLVRAARQETGAQPAKAADPVARKAAAGITAAAAPAAAAPAASPAPAVPSPRARPSPSPAAASGLTAEPRSEAERELLRALRSVR